MKKIKTIVCIFAVIIAILLPIAIPFIVSASLPSQYSQTFVGALDEKVERLRSIEGEKCVVIGGSSVAFGIDSALMEEQIGMPVVNFGLYAAIGTRAMLELSRSSVGDGDIIILAPETDAQTLSMYFSSDMTLKAIDSDYSLISGFSADSILSMLGRIFKHSTEKLEAAGKPLTVPQGIYSSSSFDEYGDIKKGIRENNVMPLYYDPNTQISFSTDIIDGDFIDYVNEYVRYCRRRGAEVYFTFAPMNELAIATDTTEEQIEEFELYLDEVLECDIISSVSTYIMEAGYFYDTNYHLNDTGVTYRTRRLLEDLLFTKMPDGPIAPELPGINSRYDGPEDENAKYFIYEPLPNGTYQIVGLTDEGKLQTELTIPLGAREVKVAAIGAYAFAGGVATDVIVPEGSNLRNMFLHSFADCNVSDLWIYYEYVTQEDKLAPAPDFGGIIVHVPPESEYMGDYDWLDSSIGYEFIDDAVR